MIRTRVITGALLGVALIVTVLFLPTPAMAAMLGVLWVVGAWEWAGLARLGADGAARVRRRVRGGMVAAQLLAGADAEFVISWSRSPGGCSRSSRC